MNKTKNKGTLLFLIPAGLLLISFILFPWLPDDIPMQFDMDGTSSWTLPKLLAIWIMPALEILLLLLNRNKDEKWQIIAVVVLLTLIQIGILLFTLR